jgi:hypothetical protein
MAMPSAAVAPSIPEQRRGLFSWFRVPEGDPWIAPRTCCERLPKNLPSLEAVQLLLFRRQWTTEQIAEFARTLRVSLRVLYLVSIPASSTDHEHAREFLVADLVFLSATASYLTPLCKLTALGLARSGLQQIHEPATAAAKTSREQGNHVAGWAEYDKLSSYISEQLPTLRWLQGTTRAYLITIITQLLQSIDNSNPLQNS